MNQSGVFPSSNNACISQAMVSPQGDCLGSTDQPQEEDGIGLAHVLVLWLIYCPIVLVTIVGNFIVITAFIRDPAINSRVANYFVFSLSLADFLVGWSMILNFVWLLKDEWVLGKWPCLLLLSVDYASAFASVLAIILISFDRYRLVTLKLRYAVVQTRRRAVVLICCCWAFCLTFYPAIVFAWSPITGDSNINYTDDCDVEFVNNFYFGLFLIAFEFVAPLLILIYLNTRLYLTIRRRAKGLVLHKDHDRVLTVSGDAVPHSFNPRLHDSASGLFYLDQASAGSVSLTSVTMTVTTDNDTSWSDAGASSSAPQEDTSDSRQGTVTGARPVTSRSTVQRRREFHKHRKAAITLSLLVGIYILCWLPFYIKNTIVAFCDPCLDYYFKEVTDNLLWCNSTINPFLYALLNRHYRRYFGRVFRRVCCWFKR